MTPERRLVSRSGRACLLAVTLALVLPPVALAQSNVTASGTPNPFTSGATITITASVSAGDSPESWCFEWEQCYYGGEPFLQVSGSNGFYQYTEAYNADWQDAGPGQTMQATTYTVVGGIAWTVCLYGVPGVGCYDYMEYDEGGSTQFTVSPTATPVSLGVTPSSGGGPIQTFTFQYSDAAGASDISQGWQVFANQFGTVQACVVGVVTWSWTILLWNDAGTAAAGTAQLGSGTILENSQCRVHAATSSASASGNTLTIVLSIEFKANYSGLKNIYAYAASWGAGWSSTVDVGDWTARSRIDSLSPSSANIEQTITINGLGFAALPNGPSVTVNGIVASVSSWSNTAIQAVVPPTTSGPVVVSTQGQASNSQTLTVLQGPVISGLSPWWGPVDTSVVISGSHFGTSGTVRFWCPSSPSCPTAQTTAWSDGSITAIVPAGATTGLVTVTRAGLSSNGVPFVVGDEGEEYVHTDAIGSVRMVTGHDGYVLSRHDYLPFGDEWPPGGTPTRVGFAGTERDGETETASWTALNYLGARHEHAASGRFTAVDPGHVNGRVGDPQSWNGYAYALNNPLRFFDPGGTQAVPIPVPGIDVVVKGGLSEVMLQAIDRAHSITITLGEAVSNLVDTVTGTEVAQGPGLGEADIPPKEPVVHPVVMTAVVVVTTRRGGKQLARSAPRSWSAARGAYWKKFGPNGKAPTREVLVRDTRTGQMYRRTETKELHHKVQRQHGGTNDESNLIEAWPTEHGAIDPHRHPGYEVIRVLSGP